VRIDYEFTVGVPVDRAWGRMLDLEKIAPCLPGAAIQEQTGEDEYAGTIRVEIGPITVSYKGTVMFEEIDEDDHRAVLRASGRETRGQGTATATIVSTLREDGDGTRATVETDMRLTGRVAQFGRGIAQDVAKGMLDEFAACLEREISGENTAELDTEEAAAPSTPKGADAGAASVAAGGAGGIAGGESPDPISGTVEGAIFVGSNPSEAAASAPTTSIQQPKIQTIPPREPQQVPQASEPYPAGQDAILRRLRPALTVASVLLIILWLLRRAR